MQLSPRLDLQSVRRNFNRAAPTYAPNAVVANEIHARLLDRLAAIKLSPARILDLGGGNGLNARSLSRRFPRAALIVFDLSQEMLRSGMSRNPWRRLISVLSRTRYARVCGDMHRLPFATASVDLLWSNLALPWAVDLDAVLQECARVLTPGGLFLFSSCGPDTLLELRQISDCARHLHTFPDMHDVGDALMRAGLAEPVMEMDKLSITYSDCRALRNELRTTGSSNALALRSRGLSGRKFLSSWHSLQRDTNAKITTTLEAIYGHAWKPAANKMRPKDKTHAVIQMHFPRRPD